MKLLNQHYFLLAAAMLSAGIASAQGPTNQLTRTPDAPFAPDAPGRANSFTAPNGSVPIKMQRGDYSQDSYVSQSGFNNYANVQQVDNRSGASASNGSGSSASIVQANEYNNAYQTQSLDASSSGNLRNEMRSTQNGEHGESRQTQTGGYGNTAAVMQAFGSSGSYAVQTQTGGSNNSAAITQSQSTSAFNYRNSATQTQTGSYERARIVQQGQYSVATQTQSGNANSADISQGAGANNTAIQIQQNGNASYGRIVQSSNSPQDNFDRNYAKQTQIGSATNADIYQRAHDSYAEQVQVGFGHGSRITQGADGTTSNVASAAYTTQNGMMNSATISQR